MGFLFNVARLTKTFPLCLLAFSALHAQTGVLTWHNDNSRTGQNLQETTLTPANVNSAMFGKLFVLSADGKVDAQPLYVPAVTIPSQGKHNVLYVVTEHDSAYAFDADNGAPLWHVSLLASGETPSDDHGCSQVTPEIGATATPAIDLQVGTHGTIYIVATSKDSSAKYHHRLHALDITTGAEQFGGAVEITATSSGAGVENTFNPTVHKERPGLLILNGVVYTTWGSHCDASSYVGWVIGYNETTLVQTSALNLVPNGNDGGLWNAGSGPAADSTGNIYALTGNGTFDTVLNAGGFPTNNDYGNAFVKITTTNGPLSVIDYFTMSNTTPESNGDVDLGSGGLVLLPPLADAQGHLRDLAVGAGKDKHIYVVDRTNLGKFSSSGNLIYQDMPNALPGGMWSSPAWFNGHLYYGDVGGTLKAFAFSNGLFQTTPASVTANTFPYPGTTPSISANGASNGIVWAVENSGTAVLHAYDAANLATELYNSNQAANSRDHFGAGNKFIVPTIINGKVYVGTTNGVGAFGLLCSYSLSSSSATAPAGGATQSVNVIVAAGCPWTAATNSAFLSISSGTPGNGNGTVNYQVSANTGAQRSGTLTIAGQTFTVTQSAAPPDLTIAKTHTGVFHTGDTAKSYTIAVTNSGGSATSGTISVSDTLPAGLTATGIGGTGWTCTQPAGPCMRTEPLGAGLAYASITLTVNVTAAAGATITNTATVSGGGETNTANDTSSDSITIAAAGGTNIAIGKSASQSSTLAGYPSAVASSAIDGNTDGNFFDGSVSHTNADANAWWQVDLGASASITSIAIWNRTDCCSGRLSDYWVFASNTPFAASDTPTTLQGRAGTWSSHQTTFPNPSTTIPVNAQGRYVRVQLSGADYLHLAEVQVFGSGGAATYGISGQVTLSGSGLTGVTVALTGSQSATMTTGASGNFSFTGLAAAGNYTVTPSLSGYTFSPPSQTFNNLNASQIANFTATGATNTDLALGKAATQSSTLSGAGPAAASNAVDGNTDGNFADGSVSHTNLDANAWWQVDLGVSATIGSIAIWNRTDCCSDRLSDYWVFVSNTPFASTDTPVTLQGRAGTWSSHQTTFPNPSSTLQVNTAGRYVRVQLSGTNYLHLAEVQIFGSSGATTYSISGQVTLSGSGLNGVNVSLTGTATNSTTTNATGNYSFTGLPGAGNYTVTPSLSGYTFTPPSQTFNNLSANQTANFTAAVSGNLALGKTATQSSTLTGYGPSTAASSAIDGNTDGNFSDGSVSHTNADANAWWQVDLAAPATISSIVIWNRTDCCSNRLSDYWVFVSDTPFAAGDTPATLQGRAGTWSSHQTTFPNPSTTIAVNTPGRYVRVQLSGDNYLSLAEVQVFGQ